MIRSLRLALLFNLLVIPVASAQSTPRADDFSRLDPGRKFVVVSDSGTEMRGRLARSTPETLAMVVKGREVVFQREQVTRVFELGDSLRNGMIVGGLAGGSLGAFVVGGFAGWGGCSGACQAGAAIGGGALFGLMGVAAGAGIDAIITGRRLIYEKAKPAGAAFSIVPSLSPSRVGLMTRVVW